MSYAVQHNLPIFDNKQVIPYNGKYYINARMGFEKFLGVMNTSPRRDYYAYLDEFKGLDGFVKIGRLDLSDVTKKMSKKNDDSILIEVIPNKYDNIIDFGEFVPKMRAGYLTFSAEEVKMSFFEWMSSIKMKYLPMINRV
jgi:hypothetical protein